MEIEREDTAAFDTAYQFYSQCLKYNPNHVLGLYGLSQMNIYKKDYRTAIINLNRVLSIINKSSNGGDQNFEAIYPVKRILASIYLETNDLMNAYYGFQEILGLQLTEVGTIDNQEIVIINRRYYNYDADAWIEYSQTAMRLFLEKHTLLALNKEHKESGAHLTQEQLVESSISSLERALRIYTEEIKQEPPIEISINLGSLYAFSVLEEGLVWNQDPERASAIKKAFAEKGLAVFEVCTVKLANIMEKISNNASTSEENMAEQALLTFYQNLWTVLNYNHGRMLEAIFQKAQAKELYKNIIYNVNAPVTTNASINQDNEAIMGSLHKIVTPILADANLRLGLIEGSEATSTSTAHLAAFKKVSMNANYDMESIIKAKIIIGVHYLNKKELKNAQGSFEEILAMQTTSNNSYNNTTKNSNYTRNLLGNIFLTGAQMLATNKYSIVNAKPSELQKQLTKGPNQAKMDTYLSKSMEIFLNILKVGNYKDIYAANGIGCVLAEQGLYNSALGVFKMVKEHSVEHKDNVKLIYDNYINLGHCYFNLNMLDQAIKMYTTCLKRVYFIDPLAPEHEYIMKLKSIDKHELSTKLPNIISAMLYLARTYFKSNEISFSITILSRIIHLSPHNLDLIMNLGFSHERLAVNLFKSQKNTLHLEVETIESVVTHINHAMAAYGRILDSLAAVAKAQQQKQHAPPTSSSSTSDNINNTDKDIENNMTISSKDTDDAEDILLKETEKMGMGRVQPHPDTTEAYKSSYHYQKSEYELNNCKELLKEALYYQEKIIAEATHKQKQYEDNYAHLQEQKKTESSNVDPLVLAVGKNMAPSSALASGRKAYITQHEDGDITDNLSKTIIESLTRASQKPQSAASKKRGRNSHRQQGNEDEFLDDDPYNNSTHSSNNSDTDEMDNLNDTKTLKAASRANGGKQQYNNQAEDTEKGANISLSSVKKKKMQRTSKKVKRSRVVVASSSSSSSAESSTELSSAEDNI